MLQVSPRSLADALRQRDDLALAALLTRRPDLLHPIPSDITALAARSTTGPSVSRCLDTLDALTIYVLAVVARQSVELPALPHEVTRAVIEELDDSARGAAEAALRDLQELALVWGTDDEIRAIHAVRDHLSDVVAPTWPPPSISAAAENTQSARSDEQAGVHAREAIAQVRDLLDAWAVDPPSVLRAGGLAVRDFSATARDLNTDAPTAALWIEVAHAAGLLDDDGEERPSWVPTDRFDTWLDKSAAEQWVTLAGAWLTSPRLSTLATDKSTLLANDSERRAVVTLRAQVMQQLAAAKAPVEPADLIAILDYSQPRRSGELRSQVVHATYQEATLLGLMGANSLTTPGRALIGPDSSTDATSAITALMPVEIDHVLIQADLTMIAPGPVAPELARKLRLLADVESRGHATVYRLSEQSLRRAFDAGWDAAKVHEVLSEASTTGLPQPLSYLIDDLARRHGAIRVGAASAYLRCDNEGTIGTILGDRRLRGLQLSQTAPNILISQATPHEFMAALRDAGYAPAAESPDGSVVVLRPDERRVRSRHARKVSAGRRDSDAMIASVIKGLRSGDRAARAPRGEMVVGPAGTNEVPRTSSAATLAALRLAIAETTPVWIGYADADGTTTEQIIDPIRMGGGSVTAFDHRTEQVKTFLVSRISGVAPLTP